jgi:hypothetical protein
MEMHGWQTKLNGDSLSWLLEPDQANPGVRYFALRDLLDQPETDVEVIQARRAVMATGPVPVILKAQAPERRLLGQTGRRLLTQISRHRLANHLSGRVGGRPNRRAGPPRL